MAVATTAGLGGFEPLVEAMPDGILIADTNGRILYVNQLAQDLSGYPREELVGLAVETLVPERLRGAHLEHLAGYAAMPRSRPMGSGLAIHLLRKDGTELPVDIALSPVDTEAGAIVVGAIRVATDRALAGQAESELSQSEERFRLVVSGVADYAIILLDPAGRVVSWNDGAQGIKGYESSEIIGQHFSRFYPPEDIAGGKPERELEVAAAQGRFEDLGWRVRKDGSRFWANVVMTALRTDTGDLLGFLRITRDMTERKLAEESRDALIHVTQAILEGQEAERVLRLIVQHAMELVGADGATGLIPDLSGTTLGFRVAEGIGADSLQGTRISMTQSISGDVMRTGRPLNIPDVSKDPRGAPQVAMVADFGPSLFVPLLVRGRAIGIIVVFRLRGGPAFTDEHLRVAELFAAQAAIAMDHARTAGARRRALDRLQATAEVTNAILQGRTTEDALRLIAGLARKLVGSARAVVLIPESPGGAIVVRAADGERRETLVGLRLSGDSLPASVMRSGRSTAIAEAETDERFQYPELSADLGPLLCVPLLAGGRPVGALGLARARGGGDYTEEDVSVAESFAAQAAVVVKYGHNLAEREKADRRVAAGMEVTQAIIEGRDTTDVLKLIAARARHLVGAALAAIVSPEPGGDDLVVRAADGAQADALLGARIPAGGSLSGQILRTRRSVTVADASSDARVDPAVAQIGKLGPALFVPLYVANRSIGAIMVANQRGGPACTAEDLSVVESFAAQAAVSFEIAMVRERLQGLTRVTIAGQKPLEDALAALARTVVEATDTIACAIFLIDAERHLSTAGTYGLPAGFARAMDLADRAGAGRPPMEAIESRTLVVREGAIRRFLSDPLFEPVYDMLRGVSWDTIVSVPLMHEGRVVGALSGYYPRGYRLSDAEVAFLKIVADQAAAIAENARLFTDAQAHVALEERQRLARELHDSVSQALFGIALGARTAREHLERNPAAARAPLDYVLQLAEVGLAEMRALIFELRPESLEKEGLVGALAKQAAALRARHGIRVDEVVDAEPEAPIAVKEALFRIAQEALNNTAKHARASHVEVRLASAGEMLVAEIRDDGAGFDADAEFPGHLGLQSMRERALRLGGSVEISSSTGHGTIVRAMIPRRVGS